MFWCCKIYFLVESSCHWCINCYKAKKHRIRSVQFSRLVVSDSLQLHEPQHARPPCPSPTLRVHPNPCPSSQWCHPSISSSVVPLLVPLIFPSIRVFSNESALRIRWPKYWSFSFSISPSNEHLGLISLQVGSPCSPRDSQESSPTPQFKNQFFGAQLSL